MSCSLILELNYRLSIILTAEDDHVVSLTLLDMCV